VISFIVNPLHPLNSVNNSLIRLLRAKVVKPKLNLVERLENIDSEEMVSDEEVSYHK